MKRTIFLGLAFVLTQVTVVSAEVRKGPYLIYPGDNTQMMVLWQLDDTRACTLEWGLDTSCSDGNAVTTQYGTDHQHKHTISGLTPGSKYYYRVTVDFNEHPGSFRAAPPEDACEVKFLGYGDTRTGIFEHDAVDAAMVATFHEDPNYQTFTLLSGDWVDDGEQEADWTNEFFNPLALNTRELQANLPINGCIGNHEYDDDSMPHTFFDKYWPYPYVGGYYWSFDYGPVHITVLDQEDEDYAPGSAQYEWLVNDLASTRKEWRILQFHKPGYSAGHHEDEEDVQNWIQPLCLQYGVDVVFAGHNHYYARCDKDGVKHITAGGGGAPLRTGNPLYSECVEVYEKAYHFCKIHIRENELDLEAVKPDGTVIDAFGLKHPKVELGGPEDGATVDANGAVFSCQPVEGAVCYQLLVGRDAEHTDYLVSDTSGPPAGTVTTFPFAETWWTVRVRNQYGRYFYAKPRWINALNVKPIVIENLNSGGRYYYIQQAIDDAEEGDEIVVGTGPWQYLENVVFKGKSVTLRSTDPEDPGVVALTVINGGQVAPTVTFSGGEDRRCVLAGVTITGGQDGICCFDAWPTITKCRITGNAGAGIRSKFSRPRFFAAIVTNCTIVANGGDGIWAQGRIAPPLTNCLIAGNKGAGVDANQFSIISSCTIAENGLAGISGYNTIVVNCVVWGNSSPQIVNPGLYSLVSHSDVQGGYDGAGNMNVDPCFVEPGHLDTNGVWVKGDYRLLGASDCVDSGNNAAVSADVTDLDGDGNRAEPTPWDLDGKPRISDGDGDCSAVVDMGAYEFWPPPIEATMKFTPQALNPTSQGNWVKAHLVLPEEFALEDIDYNRPARITEPFEPDIESEHINVFVDEAGMVEIEAAFGRSDFCALGIDGNVVGVTVVGSLTCGRSYYGTDRVKITSDTLAYLAGLASYWLQGDCGVPDWCGGLDLDRNGTVNFVDFALSGGCCIEIAAE